MSKKAPGSQRREESLSRDRIIEVAITLLDHSGEHGLTFRVLSERLATGPGAIYWHIADKSELLTAACDAIVARTLSETLPDATPEAAIRALASGMFEAMEVHPWVGSVLTQVAPQLPLVRIIERLGKQVRSLAVSGESQWAGVSALLNYILGVAGRNAANTQLARMRGTPRSEFLKTVATMWSELDPDEYPFTRSMVGPMQAHDDRADFLVGIDFIVSGIKSASDR